MRYKLRGQYTQDPEYALQEILEDRGVQDIASFMRPTSTCELDPYNLSDIEEAADLLLKHLRDNSRICVIVD